MYVLENNVEWTTALKNAFKHNITRAKILYDNIEINENNALVDLSLEEQRYISNYGFIGTATSRKLEFNIIDSMGTINLENKEVTLKIGADYDGTTYYINYGNFIVDKAPELDATSGKIRVVAYDYMSKFDKPYNSTVTYPCSLLQVLQDVCSQAEVTLGTTDFANKNFVVENNQFEGYTLRQVLQNIGKCAFSWARIGQDNKLYLDFAVNTSNVETLTTDDYKYDSFKKANLYYGPINQVTYADSDIEGQEERVKDQASIDLNGLNELVIYDNLFAYTPEKRAELIQAGTRLFGLTYMPITQLDSIGLIYLDCNDGIAVETLAEETFNSRVFNHSINYNGATSDEIVTEGISKNEEAYKNTATDIFQDMQMRISMDKANKIITSMVQTINEQNNKISQVTQTVDEINSKISDIADITTSEESIYAKLEFTGINESEPITIRVYPTNTNISYLYPSSNLFPSSNLYMKTRTIRFTNTSEYRVTSDVKYNNYRKYYSYDDITDEYTLLVAGTDYQVGAIISGTVYENVYIDYILPMDLLYYDAENYDEFLLDYDSETCQVRKKVGYNADGTTYVLAQETTYTFTYPHINLTDGDYTVELLGYSNGYIFVRLMAQNIYTTQFATRSEMNSAINQTASRLELEVEQKLDSEDFTAANIILEINNDESSASISGDKVNIEGKAVHFKTNIDETKGKYVTEDLQRILGIQSGTIIPTEEDFDKYDIDNDRRITSRDSYEILTAINNNNGYIEKTGTFEINPYSMKKAIALWNSILNDYSFTFGLDGNYFRNLNTKILSLFSENTTDDSYITYNRVHLENNEGTNFNTYINIEAKENNISEIILSGGISSTIIDNTGITTPTLTQTSLESEKKNFEKYENILDKLKDINIYKYNLKFEEDGDKKHIGFVIGDKYKYLQELTNNENNAVDIYSLASFTLQVCKEQQTIIENLQNEINKLKEGK